MAVEVKLPELGENVEKGDVVRVLVKAGDVVKAEQNILELETDKATIEVPTSAGGTVSEVRVKPGDKVKVGQVVLVVNEGGGNAEAKPEAPAKAEPPKAEAPAKEAAAAKEGTPAPAKAAKTESPAPGAAAKSDAATVGAAPEQTPTAEPRPAARPAAAVVDITTGRQAPPPGETPVVPAAPSVRRYARELGVDINGVAGTGPGGRIGQEDVKQFVKSVLAGGGRAAAPLRAGGLPDFSKWGEIDVRPMSNIRRKTAEHLSVAWQAPHVTQHDKADVTALEDFRKTYGAKVEKGGGKLTVTAIAVKVVALALGRFPQFASSVDMANEAVIYKKYAHIGLAVDTPNGLLVPVIRDADRKTITEIAAELAALSQKARDKKLTLDEMAGGVFSITNLGGIGGTAFTPIINQPEVAILGMSRTATEPVWKDASPALAAGGFVPRQLLPLSLSYDHRVIDGADAARFLRFVAEGLEQPLSMYL
jgi:pyruvate dehydrogenase E2 component (dihydrolipoyllysine-residue acetyltransferase)